MHLLVDYIDPKGNGYLAFANTPEKVAINIGSIQALQEKVNEQWDEGNGTEPAIVACGRWIVVYQPASATGNAAFMHFVDFRTDLEWLQSERIFSIETLALIMKLQTEQAKFFNKAMDTIELLYVAF